MSSTDFRLTCGSPCINRGNGSVVPADQFDVDGDGYSSSTSPSESATPDLLLQNRIIATVDQGAYETVATLPPNCPNPPPADCAPLPCTDGIVNIDDLVMVITHWGNCLAPFTYCPGDVASAAGTPGQNGVVNIDDLVLVITGWTTPQNPSPCLPNSHYNAGSLSSVLDCQDYADGYAERYTEDWYGVFDKCVQGLCEAQIINCD